MVIKKGRYNMVNKKFKLNTEDSKLKAVVDRGFVNYSELNWPKVFAAELALLLRKGETVKGEEIVEFAHRLGFGDFVKEEAERINKGLISPQNIKN